MFSVVHLSKFYKPYVGGLESVVADIAEGMECGSFIVLAADGEGLRDSENVNGVSVIRAREWLNVASTSISPAYIKKVIELDSDVILHVHLPNPLANFAIFLRWLVRKRIGKIVVHWHSDIVKQKLLLALYRPIQTWLLQKADKVIVTSDRYLRGSKDLQPFIQKCIVVPIGIESLSCKVDLNLVAKIRGKYGPKKIVFSLGRHVYYKGFEYLIDAARSVEEAVFLIGGSGQDTDKYRQKIRELGLESRVFLVGRIPARELPSYYAAADVFCLPSIEKSEAFGVVQLEAMSVGTPIVSTDIDGSGVPWVNEHMKSGLVCEPMNVTALARSLTSALSEELSVGLSQGAKERFVQVFRREEMIEKIHELYQELSQ